MIDTDDESLQGSYKVIENPTEGDHGFEVTKMSLLKLQVCSKWPQDEIESVVNKHSQSGTSLGWRLETEGSLAPIACSKKDESKHYLFTC